MLNALENDIQDGSCKWKVNVYQCNGDALSLSDEEVNKHILCTVAFKNEIPLELYLSVLEEVMPIHFVIKDKTITVYRAVHYEFRCNGAVGL